MTVNGWLGAVEGYYGPPLEHVERLEMVRWLGAHGFNAYAYAPKDDPFHRARWREPYPPDRIAQFEELLATGDDAGIEIVLVVSPGLDWRAGDETHLVSKLTSFAKLGARTLGVAFDDVPPGGGELGAQHAAGVMRAANEIDARWITCPTDYATPRATAYLRAFCDGLPDGADVMWTGPSIVSPRVEGSMAKHLGAELGRPLLFAENYPVNDGAMAGVLHLGPYRGRAPDLPENTTGVFFNFMSRPRASRLALACGARFWRHPTSDPERIWHDVLDGEFRALRPLAMASRAWAGDPAPHADLERWTREALAGEPKNLNAYLDRGCRDGLEQALAAEIEPWLAQWEAERLAMWCAIWVRAFPRELHAGGSFTLAEVWAHARFAREQLFGIRWAHYPLTTRDGDVLVPQPDGVIEGANLTDLLAQAALAHASRA